MITRDFILRQIHQLVQALAQVFLHRQAGEHVEAEQALTGAIQEVTGLSLDRLRQLSRDELLALCSTDGHLFAEKATALADLLREDADPRSRERALWLYEAAVASGGTVPFDVHERIAGLRS